MCKSYTYEITASTPPIPPDEIIQKPYFRKMTMTNNLQSPTTDETDEIFFLMKISFHHLKTVNMPPESRMKPIEIHSNEDLVSIILRN